MQKRTTAALLFGTAALSTALIGGLVAQKVSFEEQLKKAQISSDSISKFIVTEIEAITNSITNKKKTIRHLESEIESESKKILEKETLYYINGVSNKGLYKTAGKGSTNSACAQLSHTIFATDSLIESPANKVDSEAILSVNPQNIIIGGKYQHVLYDELMATSEWSNNTAVKNGHVFKVPMGISAWNRYGIEIALMITWTSAVVYPEYFEYDLVKETIDFYKEFTGITLTEQQAQYILEGLTPSGEKEITN